MASPLEARLRALIEANGPLRLDAYMALALMDPEHGYYATRDPFGEAGDFVTAPEISQMFGEILGAWLINAWDRSSRPSPVHLVELGPGRGTLMADIARVARRLPHFRRAARLHLIETSGTLRERQRAALRDVPMPIDWHDDLGDVPEEPVLLVANEFFDALPIRQFQKTPDGWRERHIGLDDGGDLAFGLGPGAPAGPRPEASPGDLLEICEPAQAITAGIARRIARDGGAALIVDYGHAASGVGETLQAVRAHAFVDPLREPGEADLTAHVDFGALARTVRGAGAAVLGPMPQGEFLLTLGLLERAGRLGADKDEAEREALRSAVERLAGSGQMGQLFKVMAIVTRDVSLPPF